MALITLSFLCYMRIQCRVEERLVLWIYTLIHDIRITYDVMLIVSNTAGFLGVLIMLVIITIYEVRNKSNISKYRLLEPVVTLVIAMIIVVLLKLIVRAPRPRNFQLAGIDKYGFPSGHVARCSAIYYASKYKLLLAWTILVAFSRIALGMHYIMDVVGGYLIGLISHYISTRLEKITPRVLGKRLSQVLC